MQPPLTRLLLVALLASFPTATAPFQQSSTPQISVQLDFSITEQELEDQISSYVRRELRSLGDVIEVDEDPAYELSFLGFIIHTKARHESGFALSVLVLSPWDITSLYDDCLSETAPSDLKDRFQRFTTYLPPYRIQEHYLRAGSPDDVRSVCQKLVADIDAAVFQPHRKAPSQLKKIREIHEQRMREIEEQSQPQ